MSYLLLITDKASLTGERDADWKKVFELQDRLFNDPAFKSPSKSMLALYEVLIEKYPCITEDAGHASPWSDGPLLGNFGTEIATLGFSDIDDEIFDFVVESAHRFGLVVADPQEGDIS